MNSEEIKAVISILETTLDDMPKKNADQVVSSVIELLKTYV